MASTVRLWWQDAGAGVNPTWTINVVDYTATPVGLPVKRIRVAGDYRAEFEAGRVFLVAGSVSNNGSKTVSTVTYSGATGYTSIYITGAVTDEGAVGTIAQSAHYFEWTYAKWNPTWSDQRAVEITDRNGIIHRLISPNTTANQGFAIGGILTLLFQDINVASSNHRQLWEWVYVNCLQLDTQVTIFLSESQRNNFAETKTRKLAFKCKLKSPGNLMDSLHIVDKAMQPIQVPMTCSADGTFTTISADPYNNTPSYRTRPA